jgi:iron complex outermembrane receptor protein
VPNSEGELLDYIHEIDDQLYHDLVATYVLSALGVTISGGVTNFTDEEPPYIEQGFNATTDPSTYRMFGRGYFLRLGWKF